jgi:hypothetical protein
LLKLRIDTGSNGPNDNAGGFLEPVFGSTLDFSAKPPTDGTFGVARLFYTFSPIEDVAVSIRPNIRTTDYLDRNTYANLSFRDVTTGAFVNNALLFPINGPSAGAVVDWHVGNSPFSLRVLYAATDAANPGDDGILRGTASFTRLLYPDSVTTPSSLGDRGLLGDTYQGMVEFEYAPSPGFALRLQYSGGELFDRRFDAVGVNAEWAIALSGLVTVQLTVPALLFENRVSAQEVPFNPPRSSSSPVLFSQNNRYPQETVDTFPDACVASAIRAGAPKDQAEPYCDCAVLQVQNEFTYEEFQAIETSIQEGSPTPPEFANIVSSCRSETIGETNTNAPPEATPETTSDYPEATLENLID